MDYQIKNNNLTVTISNQGAEVQSIKDNKSGREYIWQANPDVWGRHAPVLFPIVGRLKNDQYSYQGKVYNLGQHGFARDSVFEVKEQGTDYISLVLKSNEKTFLVYPFAFELILNYRLDQNTVREEFIVKNLDNKTMIFGIGGHPGFNLPTDANIHKDNYYFKFSPAINHIKIPLKAPLLDWEEKSEDDTHRLLQISNLMFKDDAWVFELKDRNKVTLACNKNAYQVDVAMDNAPYVGLWSQYPTTADYACIEPWWGIADTIDASGNLEDKKGMNHLPAGETWKNGFNITFHDIN
ncbi:aldose 1-epimerase family protein [Lactobacillus sp. PV034]|uniref:aldose 1-epimerase family protein n=1 Tax=Lactobacillus sp. PV034 TaxID=2594495 RepID=UPI00223EF450|nr:aldose 1-epimerase family protein [Lactobacillus sp. PV034]QNQ80467.1 aldose 1-epimerase family protein [Lactobacillus sp. PV034]